MITVTLPPDITITPTTYSTINSGIRVPIDVGTVSVTASITNNCDITVNATKSSKDTEK